jgi:hypothetical protein
MICKIQRSQKLLQGFLTAEYISGSVKRAFTLMGRTVGDANLAEKS